MSASSASNTAASSSEVPVAVLYSFGGSCWASAPRLALIEKGYKPEECTIKDVDLVNGANFNPAYLKINTQGTVPTLVVPQLESAVDSKVTTKYTAITDSIEILSFLDSQRTSTSTSGDGAPARSLAPGTLAQQELANQLIALVHHADADPNFLLLSARNEEELKAKAKGLPGHFVKGRKNALDEYSKQEDITDRMKAFYDEKIKATNQLLSFFENPSSAIPFFEMSKQAWARLPTILVQLNGLLPKEDRSGFINLADLHVGAWFARILAVVGAKKLEDVDGAFDLLQRATGVEEKDLATLKTWWSAMVQRDSFKQVYAEGLH